MENLVKQLISGEAEIPDLMEKIHFLTIELRRNNDLKEEELRLKHAAERTAQ